MSERVPTTFLLVAGPWTSASVLIEALCGQFPSARGRGAPVAAGEVAVEVFAEPDLGAAFTWGRSGPIPADLLQRIVASGHAALLEVGLRLDEAPSEFAQLGRSLRDAGGLAIRVEASGLANTWEDWLSRLEGGGLADVCAAAVQIVQDGHGTFFSCGMHAFDLADVEIAMDDEAEAATWVETFCAFQLVDAPALWSGHTFRPSADVARRTLERWPDTRHAPEDGRHNPFGVWRLVPEGTSAVPPGSLALVITPSLAAVLGAAEDELGRPLTQGEVEQIRDGASAIALEPRDALAVERARGYADLEPELAWVQWCAVRASH